MDEYGDSGDGNHDFRSVAVAANSKYVAFTDENRVLLRDLESPSQITHRLHHGIGNQKTQVHLALSPLRLNRLAVSHGVQTFIFDVESKTLECYLYGIGRRVTCLTWSYYDSECILVGAIDGSVSLWSLQDTTRPTLVLSHRSLVCDHVAVSPVNEQYLASSHGSNMCFWSLACPSKPLNIVALDHDKTTNLVWHPKTPGRLLTASRRHGVRLWDIDGNPKPVGPVPPHDRSDDESDGMSRKVDEMQSVVEPIAHLRFHQSISQVSWLGEHGILVTFEDGDDVALCSFDEGEHLFREIGRLPIPISASAVIARTFNSQLLLSAIMHNNLKSYPIPEDISDRIGWQAEPSESPPKTGSENKLQNSMLKSESTATQVSNIRSNSYMKPTTILALRSEVASFAKTAKQLRDRRRADSDELTQPATVKLAGSARSPPSPASQPLISSVELSRSDDDDIGSPMPFLSPGIPARKVSPNTLPPIEDSWHLPPLHGDSVNTLLTNAVPGDPAHDSDSDDETLDGDMTGSATFMPGGANVPLPKACGALFAPNGHLLTFFPPKPRVHIASEKDDRVPEEQKRGYEFAELFPTFGNLAVDTHGLVDNSDTESSRSIISNRDFKIPSFVIQPSSYKSQQSWKTKISPVEPSFMPGEEQKRIIVQVRDIESLLSACPETTEEFQILREEGQTGADLCRHNAKVAEITGQNELAAAWYLLGLLLDDNMPLDTVHRQEIAENVVVVAKQAVVLAEADIESNLNLRTKGGKFRWADHPLGGKGLIKMLVGWAEKRADMRFLASFSAILADVESSMSTTTRPSAEQLRKLSVESVEGLIDDSETRHDLQRNVLLHDVPVLHRGSMSSMTMHEPPGKVHRGSGTSSRNQSQPATPFLDSNSITPPLGFPPFTRHNSKFSNSGSVSPEFHRSSFSAAAKYYAQSITDKFASHGTSPPLKRPDASPSNDELSSSLPVATGSWSKSVSFVSERGTAKETQLSRSYTNGEEGYDSDKTIDDNHPAPTTKSLMKGVTVSLKNEKRFTDNVSGSVQAPWLADDLAIRALLWQRYFAEHLRTQGLFIDAAELEDVRGPAQIQTQNSLQAEGIVPVHVAGRQRSTCSICLSIVHGIEQFCPSCGHTNHMACLERYLPVMGSENFLCPTGCGCSCDQVVFESTDSLNVSAEIEDGRTKTVRKKASFTDPRRWRARMDGDSW